MNTPHLIAAGQQALSLALAALFTSAMLLSLAAQADGRHADAMAQNAQTTPSAQLCAAQPGAARS